MAYEELKNGIEERTGVPACCLTGETPTEIIAKAKTLIDYARETEPKQPKTTAQQFAEWMNGGEEKPDERTQALEEYVESIYGVHDGGEAPHGLAEYIGTPAEQFEQFCKKQLAFDPFKGKDGWKPLL